MKRKQKKQDKVAREASESQPVQAHIVLPRPGYNPYGNEVAKSVLPKIVRKVEPQETGEFGLPPGVKMSAYLSRAL